MVLVIFWPLHHDITHSLHTAGVAATRREEMPVSITYCYNYKCDGCYLMVTVIITELQN